MSGLPPNPTIFLLGSGISALCAWMLLRGRAGARWGMDHADEPRKTHGEPKPRIGGLAIFPAWLAVGLSCGQPLAITVGGILVFLLGFGDDLVRLNSRKKLLAQILVALLTFAMGLRLESLPSLAGTPVELPWAISLVLTVGWIVGWTNAMNLIDGLDGLATGILLIGMAFAATIVPNGGGLAWGVAGAAAGFFWFNFPQARMFLGDGGAYLGGYLLAAFSLTAADGRGIPFLATVLCVPLLDTVYAFLRRAWRRLPVMKGDAEHIHHHLRALGWSSPVVALALHAVTIGAGSVAWFTVPRGDSGWNGLLGVLLAGGSGIWYLASRPNPRGIDQNNSASPASSSVAGSETVKSSST
jgi:UDP-GlcNAc:undecaprenyl-phosphate GlcNAc-1-phosphate transferase